MLVFGDHNAVIRFGGGGDDHVQWAPPPPAGRPFRHQPRPFQGSLLVEQEHPAGEQRLRAFGAGKPTLQFPAFLASRLLQYAAPDLSERLVRPATRPAFPNARVW